MKSPCRILLVDDSSDILEVNQAMLELAGHRVRTTRSGADALIIIEAFRPSLVCCAIGLADMSGFEVAASLRHSPFRRDMMLVALTGYGGDLTDAEVARAGFDFHLTKPVHFESIEKLVERLPCAR